MKNNRLTTVNQYGEILYCGKYKVGEYHNMGDYASNLSEEAIEELLYKLYWIEEALEDIEDKMNFYRRKGNV